MSHATTDTTTDSTAAVILIQATCPDPHTARQIAEALVTERLAACVNIVPGLQSVYRWQGAVEAANEVLLTIKSRASLLARIQTRIAALHPDDLPELIAFDINAGAPAYLDWVRDETRPDPA